MLRLWFKSGQILPRLRNNPLENSLYCTSKSKGLFSQSFFCFFFSPAAHFREPLTFLSQHSPPILEIAPLPRLRDPGRRPLALWTDGMSLLSSLMAQDQMAVIVVDSDSHPEETSSFSEAGESKVFWAGHIYLAPARLRRPRGNGEDSEQQGRGTKAAMYVHRQKIVMPQIRTKYFLKYHRKPV